MDLFLYILISFVYLMFIHLALAVKQEFNLFLMLGIFVFTGVIGWYLHSFEIAFVSGIVLSLVFY